MVEPAEQLQASKIVQEVGTVVRWDEAAGMVRTSSGDYRAQRAASCLLEPTADDFVLVSTLSGGRCYVLAVLEREAGKSARLSVDGDLDIRLANGRFAVAAQHGMSLASAQDVSVVSGTINVNAVDSNVALERLTYLGRYIRSEVEKVKSFAGSLDMVLERFSQRVKRSYRTVEQLERLRAERIDYVADKTISLRGETTLMTAKQLVKVDGEQIHLG